MLSVKLAHDVYHLEGRFYDAEDVLAQIKSTANGPLKLNLREVKAINSVGLMQLAKFVRGWGSPIEFHELSPAVVDAVNMFPHLVGSDGKTTGIRSVVAMYECGGCGHTQGQVVDLAHVHTEPGGGAIQILAPGPGCAKCGCPMALESDPSDYFFFVTLRVVY